ncbi:MAG TPA: HAD family hydrolase [Clostridiales bacterium]|nr:HAD family hydrolase [Clostridiales bacterium]
MLDTILFDLDGTLLPLDMDEFMRIYFGEMGRTFHDIIEADKLVSYVWAGTKAMISSLEKKTNEQVFMDTFGKLINSDISVYIDRFDRFYDEGFLKVRESVESSPLVKDAVDVLKSKGYSLVIATNPLFPNKAILYRINWAGLKPEDFIYVSCYEKNCYCKPNLEFYTEVLESIGKRPEQCLMVGNDVQEDMIASMLGIKTYLITNHLINRSNQPIVCDYQGTYEDFYKFVCELPRLG